MLELLSGRRAVDKNRPSGEHNLVEWAKPYLSSKRRLFRILDGRLEGQFSMRSVQKAATLALLCLSSEPRLRPTMADIVISLEKLQEAPTLVSRGPQSEQRSQGRNPKEPVVQKNRRWSDVTNGGRVPYPRPSGSPLYS